MADTKKWPLSDRPKSMSGTGKGGGKKISRTEKTYRKAKSDLRFAKMTGANTRPFERKIQRIESNRGIARTKR
jgi:hypothetical protein